MNAVYYKDEAYVAPDRIANKDSGAYVNKRKHFSGSNLFTLSHTLTTTKLYIVYSYGLHFPMWVYDYQTRQWIGNSDSPSPSTNKQKAQSSPNKVDIWGDTALMKRIAQVGYTATVAERLGVEA